MYKSCSRCGKVHPYNYKCNATKPTHSYGRPDADRLRSTNKWKRKAIEIKEKSRWLCSVCEDEGHYTYENLETHHISKVRDEPESFLDDNNLICLCPFHHRMAEIGLLKKDYLKNLIKKREK